VWKEVKGRKVDKTRVEEAGRTRREEEKKKTNNRRGKSDRKNNRRKGGKRGRLDRVKGDR